MGGRVTLTVIEIELETNELIKAYFNFSLDNIHKTNIIVEYNLFLHFVKGFNGHGI